MQFEYISPSRFAYIQRLWDSSLFLVFDGDFLHLPNETYNWKTGKIVSYKGKVDKNKINKDLSASDVEKIKFLLDQIVSAWYKENNDETQMLRRE